MAGQKGTKIALKFRPVHSKSHGSLHKALNRAAIEPLTLEAKPRHIGIG